MPAEESAEPSTENDWLRSPTSAATPGGSSSARGLNTMTGSACATLRLVHGAAHTHAKERGLNTAFMLGYSPFQNQACRRSTRRCLS